MPNAKVELEIPEADIARTKSAAERYTSTTGKGLSAKTLLAETIKKMVITVEAETHEFVPPGIT